MFLLIPQHGDTQKLVSLVYLFLVMFYDGDYGTYVMRLKSNCNY